MSKFSAKSNVHATALGGIRTGNTAARAMVPAPVTVYVGPGPTSMPLSLDALAPVQHPAPNNTDPTQAKCAAARLAAQARQQANTARRAKRAAKVPAPVAAAPVATPAPHGYDFDGALADQRKQAKARAVLQANPHIGQLVRNGAAVYYVNAPRYREASNPAALVRKPRSAAAKARDAAYQRNRRAAAKAAK